MSGPGPLSHSSASTLLGCEQKYVYYKIEGAKPDPDFEKSDATSIGSAFHWILEKSLHEKPTSITADLEACAVDGDIRLKRDDFALVHAMVIKYLRLHKRMGLKVVAVEPELQTDRFLGYIDAIMVDDAGKWWIVDLKTFKSIYLPGLPGLVRDPQLTLYAGHAAILAESLSLPLKDFGGARWRVTTKSTAKQKAGEDYGAYVKRLADEYIKSYDVPVPFEAMDPEGRLEIHDRLWVKTQELASAAHKPLRNYANCMAYFSPCQYYSRCHGGKTFTELQGSLAITVEG